jgi:sugar-specific transcriptional regulator TrmB
MSFLTFLSYLRLFCRLTNSKSCAILTTMGVNNTEIITKLAGLGLAEYESKAYLSLLGKNPATPYEIAKSSGIPTSKIYEVLSRLTEKGFITSVEETNKKRYIPIDPDEMLQRQRASTNSLLDSLSRDLSEIRGSKAVSYIWNIAGYDYLLEKAVRMISAAQNTILLSAWKDDFPLLEPSLKQASRRKVRVAVVHFGTVKSPLKQLYSHPIEDTLYQEKGGRVLAVVTDSREVLIGSIFADSRVEGAWSTNSGFVAVTEDYIKHDIYIMKIVSRFDRQLVKKFGDKYSKLRDIYRDEEEL